MLTVELSREVFCLFDFIRDPESPNPARQMHNSSAKAVLTGAFSKFLGNFPFLLNWKSMCYSKNSKTSGKTDTLRVVCFISIF